MVKNIPNISKRLLCVVDIDNFALGAVISSYSSTNGDYLPVFQFPRVTTGRPAPSAEGIFDENHLSVTRGIEFATRISNALSFLGGCEYLILGGLSENQKSYLHFLSKYNTLEIDSINEVSLVLEKIVNKKETIYCNENDIYAGLVTALFNNSILKIDNEVKDLTLPEIKAPGIVVIEKDKSIANIIAINYAFSIKANIAFIDPPETDKKEIKYLIEQWKVTSEQTHFNNLSALLYNRVEKIDFSKYQFATFFTFGAPYSLILNNIIPFTFVNTNLSPDFFIFNNLIFANRPSFHSAIVFSPSEFEDEETNFIIEKLEEKSYFVRQLVGKQATTFNIETHIREYPFEILHLCSHGGEVRGNKILEEFTDRDGNIHSVEYDEVASFSLDGITEDGLIPVTIKRIWRKFNGLPWQSKELESKNYEQHVYAEMVKKINGKKVVSKIKVDSVTDSCAIKCIDSNYQAMFNSIAGTQTYPFIFNNTCWSWADISEHFLGSGARGYIGTLWSIGNDVAKNTAEAFYKYAFTDTLLDSLYKASIHTKGKRDENVYIFWGLHFSSFSSGVSIQKSKLEVTKRMLQSFYELREHIKGVQDKKTREMLKRIIDWLSNQLSRDFRREAIMIQLGLA